ncbi:MAG: hypothetical protein Q4E05_09195 [Pseudoclavibacter sp.]|nr:hypothetical protein [Pseudoclavibacter sp.]
METTSGTRIVRDIYLSGAVEDGPLRYDERGGYPSVVPWITSEVHPIEELPADRVSGFYYLNVPAASGQGIRERLEAAGYDIQRTAEAPAMWQRVLFGEVFIGPVVFAALVLVFALSLHELRHRRRAAAVREIQGHPPRLVAAREAGRLLLAWTVPSALLGALLFWLRLVLTGTVLPAETTAFWLGTPFALAAAALCAAGLHALQTRTTTLGAVMSRRFTASHEFAPVFAVLVLIALAAGSVLPVLSVQRSELAQVSAIAQLARDTPDVQQIVLRSTAGDEASSDLARQRLLPLVSEERAAGRVLIRSVMSLPSQTPPIRDGLVRGEQDAVLVNQAYLDRFAGYDPRIAGLARLTRDRSEATLLLSDRIAVDAEGLARSWSEQLTVRVRAGDPQGPEAGELEVLRFPGAVRLPAFSTLGTLGSVVPEVEAVLLLPSAPEFDVWLSRLVFGDSLAFMDDGGLRAKIEASGAAELVNGPNSVSSSWAELAAQYLKQYLSACAGAAVALGTVILAAWSAAIAWARVRGRRATLLLARGGSRLRIAASPTIACALLLALGVLAGVPATLQFGPPGVGDVLFGLLLVLALALPTSVLLAAAHLRRLRARIMRTL